MTPIIENLRETFQYLYWDICRYRDQDVAQIDQVILDFFEEVWPSSCVKGPVQTWDNLLRSLMESLLHHLGKDVIPNIACDYSWISIFDPAPADASQHQVVENVLSLLETVYAGREATTNWSQRVVYEILSQGEPQYLEAECANPIIRDFWAAHDLPYWGVRLRSRVNFETTAKGLVRGPTFCESNVRLTGRRLDIRAVRSRIGLLFTRCPMDRRVTNVEITFSPGSNEKPMVIDRDVLREVNILYAGLLRWVRAASGTDATPPLEDFLGVAGGETGNDSVDKDLWTAMRMTEACPTCQQPPIAHEGSSQKNPVVETGYRSAPYEVLPNDDRIKSLVAFFEEHGNAIRALQVFALARHIWRQARAVVPPDKSSKAPVRPVGYALP
ncbi:hypothetical protein CcaCcLH18_10937 [Colletotrichum camelliae]|nr:hypothetical protein CcaCcLH18_10937 [Colletotrichum camelliae]